MGTDIMLLEALSWLGFIFIAVFVTLCLAAGLLYLAEVVEEYTVATRRLLHQAIFVVVALQLLLGFFSSIPLWPMTLVGTAAHIAYYSLLHDFPFFKFTSPEFILSSVLVVAHHWVVFNHFSSFYYPFDQVVSYFVLCVWLVPFTLFISLSANENVLPNFRDLSGAGQGNDAGTAATPVTATSGMYGKRQNGLLGLLTWLKSKADNVLPRSGNKTF